MPLFTESYLESYFDKFNFFNPNCKDKRIREISMRTKFCMQCKGFDACKMHPHYWLEGQANRLLVNENMALEEARLEAEEDAAAEAEG